MAVQQIESLGRAERLRGFRAVGASLFATLLLVSAISDLSGASTREVAVAPGIQTADAFDDWIEELRRLLGLPPSEDPEDETPPDPSDGW